MNTINPEIEHCKLLSYLKENKLLDNIGNLRVRALSKNGLPYFSLSIPYSVKSRDSTYKDNHMYLGIIAFPELTTDDQIYRSRYKEAARGQNEYDKSEMLFGMLLNTDEKIYTHLDPIAIKELEKLIKNDEFKSITFRQVSSKLSDSQIDLSELNDASKSIVENHIIKGHPFDAKIDIGSYLRLMLNKAPRYIIKNDDGFLKIAKDRSQHRTQDIREASILVNHEVSIYTEDNSTVYDICEYIRNPNYKEEDLNKKQEKGGIKLSGN